MRLEEEGQPFTTILQLDQPLNTDFWDGHEARVVIMMDGKTFEGYGSGKDIVEAYAFAYDDALRPNFPDLRDTLYSYVEEIRTRVSNMREEAVSSQEMGTMMAKRLTGNLDLLDK